MTIPGLPASVPGEEGQPRRRTGLVRDQRVLFLAVGAFNTAFGVVAFVGLQLTLGRLVHYLVVLLVAHVVTVLLAFVLHRHYVFQVTGSGSLLLDLARFESVYLGVLGLNVVALPLLVEVVGLGVIPAQLLFGAVMAVVTWFGHKNFSFRRRPGDAG